MAKEDFCFTYYDGDALRDMSHMNRLERGGYNDIVLQQRKFGWLTIDQIKKILGKDFDEIWPSVNLVLIFDEIEKKYYVDWLHKSVQKMRTHSKLQSERAKNSRKKAEQEPNGNQTEAEPMPQASLKEDGNGDGYVIGIENIKVSREKIEESIFTDEVFIEQLKLAHRGKDLRRAFAECYLHHSNSPRPPTELWEWRQKLNTWLTIKGDEKKKANGNNQDIGRKQQHTTKLAASVAEAYSHVFTGGQNGPGREPSS
jgi:hypothetical protein